MKAHKVRTKRKILTVKELSEYFKTDRGTMRRRLGKYGVDLRDGYEFIGFIVWYVSHYETPKGVGSLPIREVQEL